MRLRGRTGLSALVALVVILFAMPARTTTIGVATVPALCAHDISTQDQPDKAAECKPVTEEVLTVALSADGYGALNAPERQALANLSPDEAIAGARDYVLGLIRDSAARTRRADIPLLRGDMARLRAGLVAFGPVPLGAPVINISAPAAGLDPTDFAFPGEAVARLMIMRRGGEIAEWTGAWGPIVAPLMPAKAPKATGPAPITPLYYPVRSPLNLPTIPPPRRVPQSGTLLPRPAPGGGGLSVIPAPVPLPPSILGLGGAVALLLAARRRRGSD